VALPKQMGHTSSQLDKLGITHYVGEMTEKGLPHGIGKATYSNDHQYTGSFVNGIAEGSGNMVYANGTTYTGTFIKGLPDGHGIMTFFDGHVYEGEFKGGRKHGQGRMVVLGSFIYYGTFEEGIPNGYGQAYGLDGTPNRDEGYRYTGYFKNGKFEGQGCLTAKGGYIKAQFQSGQPVGLVELMDPHGLNYMGDILDGLPHGRGSVIKPNGSTYDGFWHNGLPVSLGKAGDRLGRVLLGTIFYDRAKHEGIMVDANGLKWLVDFKNEISISSDPIN